jgi:riboflavin-specific deaminase-like protein
VLSVVKSWLRDAEAFAAEKNRPLVTLSYAQSLDGSLTLQRGKPLGLSSAPTLRLTHQLRALHDAILVGIGTVLADNPRLTVRLVRGKQPQPVVLDSHLRLPLTAALLQNPPRPPWIATVETPHNPRWQTLQSQGAVLLSFTPNKQGRPDWRDLLTTLYRRGICSLMVEGGAQVIHSLLEATAADQVVITLAPRFVGGLPVLEQPLSQAGKLSFPSLEEIGCQRVGGDLVVWGKICYPPPTPG